MRLERVFLRVKTSFFFVLALVVLLSGCRVRFEYSILYPLDEPKKETQKKQKSKPTKAPVGKEITKAPEETKRVQSEKMVVAEPEQFLHLEWASTSKAEPSFYSRSVCCAATEDGGVIDAGEFTGAIWFERERGEAVVLEADSDVPNQYVAKYNKEGAFEWVRKIIPHADAEPLDVCVSKDGYVYVLGYYQDSISIPDGDGEQVTFNANKVNRSAYICCYNPVGDFQWARNIEHCDKPRQKAATAARSIECTPEGDLIVAGGFINGIIFSPESESSKSNITNSWETTGFWAKYSSGGDLQWVRYIDGSLDSGVAGISIGEDDEMFFGASGIGGNIAHKGTGNAMPLRTPVAGRSHIPLFCDKDGFVRRFKIFESKRGSGHAAGVAAYPGGGMVMSGYNYRGSLSFPIGERRVECDILPEMHAQSYITRLNDNGEVLWVRWLKPVEREAKIVAQENDIFVDAYGSVHSLAIFSKKTAIAEPGGEGFRIKNISNYEDFRLLSFSPQGDLLRAITIGKDRPIIIKSIAPFDDGKGLYISGFFSKSARVNDELGNHRSFKATGKTQRVLIRYDLDDQNKGLLSWF